MHTQFLVDFRFCKLSLALCGAYLISGGQLVEAQLVVWWGMGEQY